MSLSQIPEPGRKLSNAQLRRVKLFIGTPTYLGQCATDFKGTMIQLLALLSKVGIEWEFRAPNGEMVARARNRLLADFLETDCTHSVQIDSDMGFPPRLIVDMLRANLHVVGALYPLKQIDWARVGREAFAIARQHRREATPDELQNAAATFCFNPLVNSATPTDEGRLACRATAVRGAFEVGVIGTGVFMTSRFAIQRLIKCYPELTYADDYGCSRGRQTYALFDYGIEGNRYLSEDYRFCHRWRAIGGRVWSWPWAEIRHSGAYLYRGEFSRRLKKPAKKPAPPPRGKGRK